MAEEKYKIVVFGAFGAGKSTLIQTLDPQAKHIEAECSGGSTTTIALDYGRVQIGEKRVYLYGTPGQERFEFAREIIGRGMDGAILLVDTTSPVDEFVEHLHNSIGAEKIPFVVFLNKCDAVGAQPDEAKAHFPGAGFVTVSSKDRKQARAAVEGFIGTLRPHATGSPSA
jgi:small GTP-binding protein